MRPLLCLPFLAALAFAPPASATPPTPTTAPAAPSDAKEANDFGTSMYGALRDEKGNIFFSAPSLREALGVAYLGARGDTAKQMSSAIHLDSDLGKSSSFAKTEIADFQSAKGSASLDIANRLWAEKKLAMNPGFTNLASQGYGAPVEQVDFIGQPGASRKTINGWVEKLTHDKIKDLLPEPAITSDTRLVITNAVYFKGTWAQQFDKKATRDEAFLVDGTTATNVPMMHHKGNYGYGSADGAKILEMKYEKSDLAMDIILPDSATGIRAVEDKVIAGKLDTWTSAIHSTEVNVSFPKLTFTWGRSVKPELQKLGMKTAFEGDADFKGIASPLAAGGNLKVSDVIHKAFVAIDEEGTEAAASTAVIIVKEAAVMMPTTFKADHPFLFVIRDTKHGRVLFMGRVMNPKA